VAADLDGGRRLSPLLAAVADRAEGLADALTARGGSRAIIVGPAGAGKASAIRHTKRLLDLQSVPAILLEATADDLAPISLLDSLLARLTELGHPSPGTNDADRPVWDDLLRSGSAALEAAVRDDDIVVLLSGSDRLERFAVAGGAPGRHAADVLDLLGDHAHRLGTSTATPRTSERRIELDLRDLDDWLRDASEWQELADAAAHVASHGDEWRQLPALTLRLLVALARLDALPSIPPPNPRQAGRTLAEELAKRRATRPVWAAWQLVAALRGPLELDDLSVLLQDLPDGTSADPLLSRCLLFWHNGWHLHPSLRQVAERPPQAASARTLPADLRREAGRRMVSHFRVKLDSLRSDDMLEARALVRAALVDACSMAQDDALADGLMAEVPDPYDHIGRRSAEEPRRSRSAFQRAAAIDEYDATALRGLADAEDREAVDAAKTERLLRRVLGLEPQDIDSHIRLIDVLLAAGRPQAAVEAFNDAASRLAGVFDDRELTERLFVPAARVALPAGNLVLASRAASAARESLPAGEARELDRLVRGLIEALEYGEFVPARRLGTTWWTAPEILADVDAGGRPLTRWLAARVDEVAGREASLNYADISIPADEVQRPERAWTTVPIADLKKISHDKLPAAADLPGTLLEIGIYGDDESAGSTIARVAEQDEIELPHGDLSLERYARNAR
jgi:hypothetical protein